MLLKVGELYVYNQPKDSSYGHCYVRNGMTLQFLGRGCQWRFVIVGGKYHGKEVGIVATHYLTPVNSEEEYVYSD